MQGLDPASLPTLDAAKARFLKRKDASPEADHATVKDEMEWEDALARSAVEKVERESRPSVADDQAWAAVPAGLNPFGEIEKGQGSTLSGTAAYATPDAVIHDLQAITPLYEDS